MKVAIIYFNFLDATGAARKIGGVETYLWYLSKLIAERGDDPVLFQPATIYFEKQVGQLKVIGITPNRYKLRHNIRADLYEAALSYIDKMRDFIIFGADIASIRTNYARGLSIQHGIGWDMPSRFLRSNYLTKLSFIPGWFVKQYIAYRSYLYFNNCKNRVCVDYNFLNWYRTQIADIPKGNIWIIPNFVDIPDNFKPDLERHFSKPVKIIFARRFVEYRGSSLMIDAAKYLLTHYNDVEFCFAGEGPDEILIKEAFNHEPRVSISTYASNESLQIHNKFHIAVIPSLASEGTSLSLAEAMAAGCAVVATNVGGMTNMIIDGYNGRIIDPSAECLIKTLNQLIPNVAMRYKLGQRASEVTSSSFSLESWKSRWSSVLDALRDY